MKNITMPSFKYFRLKNILSITLFLWLIQAKLGFGGKHISGTDLPVPKTYVKLSEIGSSKC
jgi:hypothetical protein